MKKSFAAGLVAGVMIGGGALVAAGIPNPENGECFIVGRDMVSSDPTFTEPVTEVVEFRLVQICGELHPGSQVGAVVQRDEFKVLVMDRAQAEIIVDAAQDWIDAGLIEPSE